LPKTRQAQQICEPERILKLRLHQEALPALMIFALQTRDHSLVVSGVVLQFADSGKEAAAKSLAHFDLFVCHDINLWGRLKFFKVVPMIRKAISAG
jgi:hypothetical protein